MQELKQERAGGIALIVAVLLGLLVMSHHPTGHDLTPHDTVAEGEEAERVSALFRDLHGMGEEGPSEEQRDHSAFMNRLVHGVGMAVIGAVFLGLMGLRRASGGGDWAVVALGAQAVATLAGMMAALASGFIATPLFEAMAASTELGEARRLLDEVRYTHRWNQAFAQVYGVAFSLGLLAWAGALRRGHRAVRSAGWFGAVLGLGTLFALLGNHLTLGVHGFTLMFAGQGIWMIWVGVLMLRGPGKE